MANTCEEPRLWNQGVVIVGVADDVNELIGEHNSIKRALTQIRIPRMSNEELRARSWTSGRLVGHDHRATRRDGRSSSYRAACRTMPTTWDACGANRDRALGISRITSARRSPRCSPR